MEVQERLSLYLKLKGLNYKEFESVCNLGNGSAAKLSINTRSTTLDRISKYCDLDTNWLLTGEGEMLRETPNQTMIDSPHGTQIAAGGDVIPPESDVSSVAVLRDQLAAKDRQIDDLHKIIINLTQK